MTEARPDKTRICAVIPDLRTGGAQRVLLTLVEEWARQGHTVFLLTLDSADHDFFTVPPGVQRVSVGGLTPSDSALTAIRQNTRRIRGLRRAIAASRPDVVVSFIDLMNVTVLAACLGLRVRTFVSERVYPPAHHIGLPWRFLRRALYPSADGVVMQTQLGHAWATAFVNAEKVAVIPNPVSRGFLGAPSGSAVRTKAIVAAGRLVHQKGFDLLLAAFARSRARALGWRLRILGDGVERGALTALAALLGVSDVVELGGASDSLAHEFSTASVFVLPSRGEGFPNALLEAMAMGCAVIATDCTTGPRDMVSDGVDGILVPNEDVDRLTEALNRLMGSQSDREELGRNATRVRERFAPETIANKWIALFDATVSKPA
ncbi:MAG TPA: glycosyltransferase family 4 protein [Gemmatimonadaceae bacterium]|nr:glycosyltransferase family 4 protein [Gemmatimonadaceae bacterium]